MHNGHDGQYMHSLPVAKAAALSACFRASLAKIWLALDKEKYFLSKDQIIKKFSNFNIETRSLWYPNHLQKPFKKFQNYEIKKSNLMFKTCLCLPSSYGLKKSDQIKIIKLLQNKFNYS